MSIIYNDEQEVILNGLNLKMCESNISTTILDHIKHLLLTYYFI